MDFELRKIESIKLSKFKRVLKETLEKFDIAIMRFRTYHLLTENSKNFRNLQEIDSSELSLPLFNFLIKNCGDSYSQLYQDLFVIYITENYLKDSGPNLPKIFVEFGACDGLKFSNTFLLEKIGWQGIVAEPARKWHADLKANRKCSISFNAVGSVSYQQVPFVETLDGEFSSLASFSEADSFADYRRNNFSSKYLVETISLNDLIANNGFQSEITYLSIDTEGGERLILESFDFKKFNPAIISVEHNFSQEQFQLDEFMLMIGYSKILTTLSKFENWYVNTSRVEIPAGGIF